MAPVFQTRAAASVVSFDKVRITLARSGGTALDTTVLFPPGADSIVLSLLVPINGASETLSLNLEMINAAGDTVFRGGPEPVTVALGVSGTGPAAPVPIRYVGVGSNAKSVKIGTRTTSLFFGDSIQLTATALDSSGQPIPGTPIAWRSLDSAIARVPVDSTGKVLARSTRGLAHIQAMLLTNQADTAQVTVQPVPAALSVVSGGGQSGAVGSALSQPVVVRVKAADSLGVAGVAVSLAPASGGSVLKATDTTNANGDVSVTWTLGSPLGAQLLTASLVASPSIKTTATATGVVGPPKKLVFQVEPTNTAALAAISPAVQVTAQDTFGNTVTTFTGNVTVAIGTNPGSSTLGGTLTVAAASGVATFSNLTLNNQGTGYTLVASATGLTSATSNGFNVTGGVPTQLAFVQQPSNAVAGAAIAPSITVAVRDTLGNTVSTFTGNVSVAITGGTGKAGATLRGTTTVAAVAGVATFAGLSVDSAATGYTLTATATGLTVGTSTSFTVVAAPAVKLAFTTQPPASTASGAAFGAVVTARDSLGNAAAFAGNVALAITGGTGKAGAALHGTTTVAASAGVATFSGLSIDSAAAGYTLTASSAGLTSATSTAITVGVGTAAFLVFSTQPPATSLAQSPFGFIVTAKDAGGNVATGYAGNVTVAIGTNPAGGTLSGTLTVPASSGVATFSGISIDNIGAGYTLVASAPGVTSATSAAFAITAALNVNAWINPAGGNWSTPANWSKGTVPVATDTVAIRQSGTYTVNLDVSASFARLDVGAPSGTQTLTVAANTLTAGNGAFASNTVLSLSGTGTIGGAGTLSVGGAFNWTGGNLGGGGGRIQVLSGGTLTIAPTATVNFQTYTLEVAGTGTWTGTQTIQTGSTGILRVASGGTLAIQGDPTFAYNLGGAPSQLNVLGTLSRTTSPNVATMAVALNDSGAVTVTSGTLRLGSGGTSTGAFSASTGATLDFNGGTHTLAAGSGVSGAGTVSFSGGAATLAGTYSPTGLTLVSGGAASFNTAAGSTGSLTVSSGTLGGSGLLTVSGAMNWTGANLIGSGGTTRVLASGTLSIAPTATVNLQTYTLEVAGTGTWTGTQTIQTGSTGILRVASGGTLAIQGDPIITYNLGGAPSQLNVLGTLSRTTSPNVATMAVALNDSGAVTVTSGTLRLGSGGTSTGAFSASTGATLDFNNGTHTLTAGSNVTGAGTVEVSGGTVNAAGSYGLAGLSLVSGGTANFSTVSGSTGALTVSSGTLGGSGLLTVSGAMSWTGGNLNGTGGTTRVLASGTLSIAPTATVNFQTYTLEVAGAGTWSGTQTIQTGSTGILRVASGGALTITGDPTFTYNLGGAPSQLNVLGTLTRSTSANPAVLNLTVNDSGTVNVQTGTLRLGGGGISSGVFAVSSGATLDFNNGTHTLAATSGVSGAGTVSFSGATATLAGGYSPTGATLVSGGTANFNTAAGSTGFLTVSGGTLGGSGLLQVSGPMSWTGGNLNGAGGTTRVLASSNLSLAPAGTVQLQTYTLDVAGAGIWSGTQTIQTGSAGILRVASGGTLNITGSPTFTYNLGGAASSFNVLGTLTSTSPGVALMSVALNDSGTVSVQGGTLRLAGGGTSSGSYVTSTTLDFNGGTHSLAATTSVSGVGTVSFSGGTVTLAGSYTPSGSTVVSGGTANFNTAAGSTFFLGVSSGTLGGSGLLTVSGTMSWTGGNLNGAGGRTLVNGTLNLAPAGTVQLQTYTLELGGTGTGTWTGTQTIQTGSSGILRVASGGTLTISGDPTFTYNLGGAASSLNVLGTLTRTTSTNPAVMNVALNDSGTVSVQSGTLQLGGGGISTGLYTTTVSGATLEFTAGTHALGTTSSITGAGTALFFGGAINAAGSYGVTGITQVAGGSLSYNGATTATTGSLFVTSGSLGGTGLLTVSGPMSWTGGNLNGAGGTTRVLASGTLSLAPTGTVQLQTYTLELAGTGTWTGTQTVQTGSGAILRVAAGGTLTITGDPTFTYNLGGAASLLDNQGTLISAASSGSPGAIVISAPISNTGTGGIQVTADTLRLTGGVNGTFPGAVTVNSGAVLEFGGSTFTFASPLTVGGSALVSAGTVIPNGHAFSIAQNFATSGSGALQMTLAADSVQIGGNATFGGGPGTMNAGVIRLAGNFTQSTAATAFAPTAAHRTVLTGSGTQNLSFANPTTSFFRRLELPATTHTVVLQTNVQVTDSLTMFAGGGAATLNGAGTSQRLTIGGLLRMQLSTASPILTPPVVELSVTPAIAGGTFSPDTTVFLGSIASLPTGAGIAYRNVRVNTAGLFSAPGSNVTYNGSVIISSGTFAFTAATDSIGGFLRTEATGALSMTGTVAAPTIAVRDSAVFAGGASTSLSAGALRVYGNFVQRGTAGQFAATGTRVFLQKASAGVQTIQMADSVNSFFNDLVLNRPIADTVRLQSNVQVKDSAIVAGSSVLASTTLEALKAGTAAVRVHSGGFLKPSRVEIRSWGAASVDSNTFASPVRIFPDTAVFFGQDTITSGPFTCPMCGWKHVRVGGGTLVTTGTTYNGSLIVSGGLYTFPVCCNGTDSVNGFLRTEGTGTLQLNSGDGTYNLIVRDSAVFGGGDETGLLVNSNLYVGGNFIQRGGSTTFQADQNQTTIFNGSGTQTVSFASPGASLSRFGTLQMAHVSPTLQPAGITLLSNVFLSGFIYDTSNIVSDSIAGQGFTVTAQGLELFGSGFVINNAPLVTSGPNLTVGALTLRNMSPTITQWTMNSLLGTSLTLSQLDFQTTPTSGRYFAALATTSGNVLNVSLSSPATLPLGTYTFSSGLIQVFWNGSLLP